MAEGPPLPVSGVKGEPEGGLLLLLPCGAARVSAAGSAVAIIAVAAPASVETAAWCLATHAPGWKRSKTKVG